MISMHLTSSVLIYGALFLRYAREDTHYLLYIYDLMRIRLLRSSAESESSDPPLIEVSSLIFFLITVYLNTKFFVYTIYVRIVAQDD